MDHLLELTIGPVAHGGHCIARHEGRVVFVRHGVPGERALVRLVEHDDGARFWRGDVVKVLQPATGRIEHFWPEADSLLATDQGQLPVGGAEWGHLTLSAQRDLKGQVFTEQLERLAGLNRTIEVEAAPGESQDGLGWRTRVAFSVTPSGRLAMHAHRSEDLVEVQLMVLELSAINALRLWEHDFSGIKRVEVAAPSSGEPPLVLLFPADGVSAGKVQRMARSLPEGLSVAVVDAHGGIERIRGRTWVRETVRGQDFRVSGPGFWQIHRLAPEVLTDAVLTGLKPQPGEHIADLYAGAGLFSAALAQRTGTEGAVLSVEGSAAASRDARKNLHRFSTVDVRQGKVERVFSDEAASGFTGLVLDPPRVGAGRAVVGRLTTSPLDRVVYVSCDPASFARDVAYFRDGGWSLTDLRVFDLYPHTHHMESVAVLEPLP